MASQYFLRATLSRLKWSRPGRQPVSAALAGLGWAWGSGDGDAGQDAADYGMPGLRRPQE